MFEKILFPTDFSAYANAVFSCLSDLQKAGLQTVILLNVIRDSTVPMTEEARRGDLQRVEWSAREQLNILQMALSGTGLRVITRIAYGSPAEQILQTAYDERVSLIVMGAQGKTLSEQLLLGSVAYQVARYSTIPVLLQKAHTVRSLERTECHLMCEQMFLRVLHPTDFSDCANTAFHLIRRLKNAGTQEVIVLHVQDERAMQHRSTDQVAEFDQKDQARLDKLYSALRILGIEARVLLRRGHPVIETLRVADELQASLIVLGTKGRSAIREILSGSTFENIMRLSPYPVLMTQCAT